MSTLDAGQIAPLDSLDAKQPGRHEGRVWTNSFTSSGASSTCPRSLPRLGSILEPFLRTRIASGESRQAEAKLRAHCLGTVAC